MDGSAGPMLCGRLCWSWHVTDGGVQSGLQADQGPEDDELGGDRI
jgi:hypothetical protein